jgi:hypothetical protein
MSAVVPAGPSKLIGRITACALSPAALTSTGVTPLPAPSFSNAAISSPLNVPCQVASLSFAYQLTD